ncbi:sulfotransferase [Simiduia sp. 21SJ11W-1]|uniref:tetratricopeptide repeat-containing sulfotransferase family protein n=1 Tax=Simiduia sp. 21SJ11W-1 TaxID=2909669 RepID=UPI00209E3FE5|nr:sulfotransferase [Simiduia sp. 21SJ11W-1]UTA48788.1 sulfotransferase [Simiduia sp. 21SJ11W-1]
MLESVNLNYEEYSSIVERKDLDELSSWVKRLTEEGFSYRDVSALYLDACLLLMDSKYMHQYLVSMVGKDKTQSKLFCLWYANRLLEYGRSEFVGRFFSACEKLFNDCAVMEFNCAYYAHQASRWVDAIKLYESALSNGYDSPEQVYTNIGNCFRELRRPAEAEDAYTAAIRCNSSWWPAYYNLALTYEEMGRKKQAYDLFLQIPDDCELYCLAIVRVSYMADSDSECKKCLYKIDGLLVNGSVSKFDEGSLLYARAWLNDKLKNFSSALLSLQGAQEKSRSYSETSDSVNSVGRYSKFSRFCRESEVLKKVEVVSEQDILFVCGMYRSGTTLLSQILSQSNQVFSAGELGLVSSVDFDVDEMSAGVATLNAWVHRYHCRVNQLYGGDRKFLDKQPNSIDLAPILARAFPNSKFLYCFRNPLDVCLSIVFQQFDDAIWYARSIESINAYMNIHFKNVVESKKLIGSNRFKVVRYEDVVGNFEASVRSVCSFASIDYSQKMSEFYKSSVLASTASVWQVRRPLHKESVGRWKNYESLFSPSMLSRWEDFDLGGLESEH